MPSNKAVFSYRNCYVFHEILYFLSFYFFCILLLFRASYTLYVVLNYVIVLNFMLQKYDFKILM